MELEPAVIVTVLVNVVTAAVLAGIMWKGLNGVEGQIESMWQKIEEQNGRVDELEKWRAGREGWQRGWDDRMEREEGPQHE